VPLLEQVQTAPSAMRPSRSQIRRSLGFLFLLINDTLNHWFGVCILLVHEVLASLALCVSLDTMVHLWYSLVSSRRGLWDIHGSVPLTPCSHGTTSHGVTPWYYRASHRGKGDLPDPRGTLIPTIMVFTG